MTVTAAVPCVAPIVTAPREDYLFSAMRITPAWAVAELLTVCFPEDLARWPDRAN